MKLKQNNVTGLDWFQVTPSSDNQLSLMTVYGSDVELTVGKKPNKDNEATRAVDCAVLFDYA